MKNPVHRLFCLLAASGFAFTSSFALASTSSVYRDKLDVPQDISLPLSQGELQAEVAAEQAQRDRANAPKTTVEAGVSTWRPAELSAPARLSHVSPFSANGNPTFLLSVFSPLSSSVELELGLGYLSETRTGALQAAGLSSRQEEKVYLAALRVGARYFPWSLGSGQLRPYVEGAVLPTLLLSAGSAFNDGLGDFGPAFELGAGALLRVWGRVALDFRVAEEIGQVGDSNLRGFSFASGLVVPL